MNSEKWKTMEYFLKYKLASCSNELENTTHQDKQYQDVYECWSWKCYSLQIQDYREQNPDSDSEINISLSESFHIFFVSHFGVSFGKQIDEKKSNPKDHRAHQKVTIITSRDVDISNNAQSHQYYPYDHMKFIFSQIIDQQDDQQSVHHESKK